VEEVKAVEEVKEVARVARWQSGRGKTHKPPIRLAQGGKVVRKESEVDTEATGYRQEVKNV
jgi:hypothetical protein